MDTSNIKIGIVGYLGIVFFIVVFLMIISKDYIYDYILQSSGANIISESQIATQETTNLLLSLDKITLNTNILNSPYLQSLNNFPSFPIDSETVSNFGKANPFIGSFIVVPSRATTSVGSLIYSNQRPANNGAIVPVSPTRR